MVLARGDHDRRVVSYRVHCRWRVDRRKTHPDHRCREDPHRRCHRHRPPGRRRDRQRRVRRGRILGDPRAGRRRLRRSTRHLHPARRCRPHRSREGRAHRYQRPGRTGEEGDLPARCGQHLVDFVVRARWRTLHLRSQARRDHRSVRRRPLPGIRRHRTRQLRPCRDGDARCGRRLLLPRLACRAAVAPDRRRGPRDPRRRRVRLGRRKTASGDRSGSAIPASSR